MSEAVEKLLREVAAHDGVCASQLARREALGAIRLLEERLLEALDFETIRGLPNLVPNGRFYAANVRADGPHGCATWLDRGGKEALVLGKDGALLMAWADQTAICGAAWRDAEDDDLRAEDLERFLQLVEAALRGHLARAGASAERDSRVHLLAHRVRQALGAA